MVLVLGAVMMEKNMEIMMLNQLAVCPICTVTVGAGLALAERMGVDNLVVSVWIGGLLASLSLWTIDWFKHRQKTFKYYQEITWLTMYGLTLLGLHWTDFLWNAGNTLFGIDKVILGIVIGTVVFIGASDFYQYLKRKNDNRAHFPFEKVAIPVLALLLTSLLAYLLTKK